LFIYTSIQVFIQHKFLIKQKVYIKIKKSPSDVYFLFQISVTFISDICQLRLRYLSVAI